MGSNGWSKHECGRGVLHRKSLSSLEFCAAAAARLVRSLCTRGGCRRGGGILGSDGEGEERQECLQQHASPKLWRRRWCLYKK